ncbi:hypothetical protein DAHU10_017010 [Hanseniaspora uvarum]|nr:hypothetical protein DAHU10_017010 [Hanseniaspora uvarum]
MQLKYFFYFLLTTIYTAATSFTIDSADYTAIDTASEQQIYKLDLQLSVEGIAEYVAGQKFHLILDRVHHISLPFDSSTISIYLKNDDSLLFQSAGIKDASSSQSSSFGTGTIIDFVATKAFNVPADKKLTMYLTLHAVFITGNDFYFYNNDYSISTVSPGTNDMGISVSASLATNAFLQGVVATPTATAAIGITSQTLTATPTYRLDVQLQWIQDSAVLGVSTPLPVLEVFGTVYPSCSNAYSFVTANYRADFDSQLSLPTNAQYSYSAKPTDMNAWTSINTDVIPAKATAIQQTTLNDGSVETEVLFQITSGADTDAYYIFGALAVPTNSNYNGYYAVTHIGSIICASGSDTTTQRWNTVQDISMVKLTNSGYATETTETTVSTSTWSSSTTSVTTIIPASTDIYNTKTVEITFYVPTVSNTTTTTTTTTTRAYTGQSTVTLTTETIFLPGTGTVKTETNIVIIGTPETTIFVPSVTTVTSVITDVVNSTATSINVVSSTSTSTNTKVIPTTITSISVSTFETTSVSTGTTVILTTDTSTATTVVETTKTSTSVTTVPTTLTSTATSQTTATVTTTKTDTETSLTEIVTTNTLTSTDVTEVVSTFTITGQTFTTTYETNTVITFQNFTSTSSYFTTQLTTVTIPSTVVTTENITTTYTLTQSSTDTINTDITVTHTDTIATTSEITSLIIVPTTATSILTFNTTYTTEVETTATHVKSLTNNVTEVVTITVKSTDTVFYNSTLTTGVTNVQTLNVTTITTQVIPATLISTATYNPSIVASIVSNNTSNSVATVLNPSSSKVTKSLSLVVSTNLGSTSTDVVGSSSKITEIAKTPSSGSLYGNSTLTTPPYTKNVSKNSSLQTLAATTGVVSSARQISLESSSVSKGYQASLITAISTPVFNQSLSTTGVHIYTDGANKSLIGAYNSIILAVCALLLAQ